MLGNSAKGGLVSIEDATTGVVTADTGSMSDKEADVLCGVGDNV
jgi:hypothetical protein